MENKNNSSFIETPDNVLYDVFLKWLNEETIRKISFDLDEPDWMLQHRLESFKIFKQIKKPDFGPDVSSIDFDNLVYYAKPKKWFVWAADSRDKVPQNIKNIFQRLNIPESEQQFLAWVGGQFDSFVSILIWSKNISWNLCHLLIISLLPFMGRFGVVGLLFISQNELRFLILCRHIFVWIRMSDDSLNIHSSYLKIRLVVVILNDVLHQNMINVHCMQVV